MQHKEHQHIDTMAVTFLKFLFLREWYQHLEHDTKGQLLEWFQERGYIKDHMFDVSQEMWDQVYKVEPHTRVTMFTGKDT